MRIALYKLRITWATTESFIPSKLYQLDMKVSCEKKWFLNCNLYPFFADECSGQRVADIESADWPRTSRWSERSTAGSHVTIYSCRHVFWIFVFWSTVWSSRSFRESEVHRIYVDASEEIGENGKNEHFFSFFFVFCQLFLFLFLLFYSSQRKKIFFFKFHFFVTFCYLLKFTENWRFFKKKIILKNEDEDSALERDCTANPAFFRRLHLAQRRRLLEERRLLEHRRSSKRSRRKSNLIHCEFGLEIFIF